MRKRAAQPPMTAYQSSVPVTVTRLSYIVHVDVVEESMNTDQRRDVSGTVRDEITSNLDSLDYAVVGTASANLLRKLT